MTARRPDLPYQDYVAAEAISLEKHEFLRGEVFAMAGGTPEHGRLAASMIGELRAVLRSHPCAVFSSDVRVRVEATDLSTYPDASVVCGQLQTAAADAQAVVNPVLLVEVLSDSTEAHDRGEKFAHYRRIPSLREYVLVSQRQKRIEVFRKKDDGEWSLAEAGADERLRVLDVSIEVNEVYRDPLAPAKS